MFIPATATCIPLILYKANDAHEKIAAEDCGAELLELCVDEAAA